MTFFSLHSSTHPSTREERKRVGGKKKRKERKEGSKEE